MGCTQTKLALAKCYMFFSCCTISTFYSPYWAIKYSSFFYSSFFSSSSLCPLVLPIHHCSSSSLSLLLTVVTLYDCCSSNLIILSFAFHLLIFDHSLSLTRLVSHRHEDDKERNRSVVISLILLFLD